jgi:hypothetical protein
MLGGPCSLSIVQMEEQILEVEGSASPVPEVLQLETTPLPPMLLCTIRYSTAAVALSHSVSAGFSPHDAPTSRALPINSVILGQRSYVYSRDCIHERIVLHYEHDHQHSQKNTYSETKIAMQFALTVTNGSSPSASRLEILVTASKARTFHWQKLVAAIVLILFEHAVHYWKMSSSIRVFTCGFNTTVL